MKVLLLLKSKELSLSQVMFEAGLLSTRHVRMVLSFVLRCIVGIVGEVNVGSSRKSKIKN